MFTLKYCITVEAVKSKTRAIMVIGIIWHRLPKSKTFLAVQNSFLLHNCRCLSESRILIIQGEAGGKLKPGLEEHFFSKTFLNCYPQHFSAAGGRIVEHTLAVLLHRDNLLSSCKQFKLKLSTVYFFLCYLDEKQ